MARTNVMKSDKGRILFVEDERHLVDMYHKYFLSKGYDFLSTKDIKEALYVTEFEQPDIVLLDIIIPKKMKEGGIYTMAEQGWDYLREVKKNPETKDIPIVVFTNLDTHQDRVKSEQMGATAYVFKRDTEPKELLAVIDEIIAKYRKDKKKKKK